MITAQLWIQTAKWFTNLSKQKAVIFLLLLIVSYLGFENYNLHGDIEKSALVSDARNSRNDSLLAVSNRRTEECNERRQADLEKSNLYWSKKYDELEKRLYEDYKTITQNKRK